MKSRTRRKSRRSTPKAVRTFMSLTLGLLLVDQGAHAQTVTPDTSAPTDQRPIISVTADGVPVVLITNPNAGGISRNAFKNFSVGNTGLILNNSTIGVGTVLGGSVLANPFLGSSARVILVEVNGGNASGINGYVEVAGPKADLIVANAFGVTVNGAAFLNAGRVTLTTGKTQFNENGGIQGFSVAGGGITVGEGGVNASNLDYFDLIARTAQIGGPVYGKSRLVLGQNTVDAGTLAATSSAAGGGAAPAVALDVGAKGGIYGGSVYVISTEKGVGVNNAGVIQSEQSLHLSADGKISLTGSTVAGENLTVQGQAVDNAGTTYALKNTQVTADQVVTNTGLLASGQDLKVTGAALDSSGTLAAGLDTQGQLRGDGQGQMTTQAQTTSLTGTTLSAGAQQHQAQGLTVGGQLAAAGDLSLGADTLRTAGQISAAGKVGIIAGTSENRGTIAAGTDLSLQATTLDALGGTLYGKTNTVDAKTILHSGTILGQQATTVTADSLTVDQGAGIASSGATAVRVTGTLNNAGALSGQELEVAAATITNSGDIQAEQLSLDTGTLNNAGKVLSGSDLDLDLTKTTNSGVIASSKNLTLNTETLNGAGGTLYGKTTTLDAGTVTDSGTIVGEQGVTVMADTLTIGAAGGVASGGTTTLEVTGDLKNAGQIAGRTLDLSAARTTNSGQVQANNLSVQTRVLTNVGTVTSASDLALKTTTLTNSGTIAAGGRLDLSIATLNGAGGTLAGNITTVDARDITSSGSIVGQRAVTVNADDITIGEAGGVASGGLTTVSAAETLSNAGSILGQDVALRASTTANSGQVQASNLSIQTKVLGNSGSVTSASALKLDTTAITNSGTIASGGKLDVTTGTLNGAGGTLYGTTTTVDASDVTSSGTIVGQQAVTVNAGTLKIGATGSVASGGATTINVTGELSTAGQIVGQDVALSAARTTNTGQVQAKTLGIQTGVLTNAGLITSGADLALRTEAITNSGTIASGGVLALETSTLSGAGGTLYGTITTVKADEITSSGTIVGQQAVTVTAGALNIEAAGGVASGGTSTLEVDGTLTSAGQLMGRAVDLKAGTITNSGQVQAGTLSVQTKVLGNSGMVTSASALKLDTATTTNSGTIASGGSLDLTTSTLNGAGGTLYGATTTVNADEITSSGTIAGQQAVTVNAKTLEIEAAGAVASGGATTLTVTGDLTNAGQVTGQRVTITAASTANSGQIQGEIAQIDTGVLSNTGSVSSSGETVIRAVTVNNAGTIAAARGLSLSTDVLKGAGGTLYGATTTIKASDILSSGTIIGQDVLTVDAKNLTVEAGGTLATNGGATLIVSDDLQNAGQIAGQKLDITARSAANSGLVQASALSIQTTILQNAGTVMTTGDLALKVNETTNSGTIASGQTLDLTTDTLRGAGGTLYGLTTTVNADDITSSGTIAGQQAVTVNAKTLTIEATGGVASGGATSLMVGKLSNAGVIAGTSVALEAATAINTGQVQAGNLSLQADSLNNAGSITAATDLKARTISATNSGTIAAGRTLTLATDTLDGAGGTLYGATTTVDARSITSSGTIAGHQAVTVNAGTLKIGSLEGVASGGATTLAVGILDSAGQIAGQDVSVVADTVRNSGQIQAGTLSVQVGALQNTGSLTSAGSAVISAKTTVNSGTVAAGRTLSLTTDTLDNAAGTLYGQVTTLKAGAITASGSIVGQDTLSVTADSLQIDARGVLASGGATTVKTAGTLANAGQIVGQTVGLQTDTTNNSGVLQASALGIQTRVLRNTGSVVSATKLDVTADTTTNSGTVAAGERLDLTTDTLNGEGGTLYGRITTVKAGTIGSSGSIVGQQAVTLDADVLTIGAAGGVASGGTTTLTVKGALTNAGQLAGQDLAVQTGKLDNSGQLQARTLALQTGTLSNTGTLLAAETATIIASDVTNTGSVVAGRGLDLTTDTLHGAGGTLYGDVTTVTARDVASSGTIVGQQAVTVRADRLNIEASGGVASGAVAQLRVAGEFDHAGQVVGKVVGIDADTVRSGGVVQANDLSIQARVLENTGTLMAARDAQVVTSVMVNSGTLAATRQVGIQTGTFTGAGGTVYGDVTTLSADTMASSGTLIGLQAVTVDAKVLTIEAAGSVASGGRTGINVSGALTSAGQISGQTVAVTADVLTNAGQVQANALSVQTRVLGNAGTLSASGDLMLEAVQASNTGTIAAAGHLDLKADTLSGAGGTLYGDVTTVQARDITATGTVIGLKSVAVAADNLTINQGGSVASNVSTGIQVRQTLTNAGTISGREVSVAADVVRSSGAVQADNLVLGTSTLDNAGTITAVQDLNLSLDNLTNSGTIATAGQLDLSTKALTGAGGTLYGKVTTVQADAIASTGTIVGQQGVNVTAGSARIDAAGGVASGGATTLKIAGTLETAGSVSGREISLQADRIDNAGSVQGNALTIQARVLGNTGSLTGAQNVNVGVEQLTNAGTLASGGDLTVVAGTLNNTGTVFGKTNSVQASTIVNAGQLAGGDTLAVTADSLANLSKGVVASNGSATLDVKGTLVTQGQIAGRDVQITAGTLETRAAASSTPGAAPEGLISASNNLNVTAGEIRGNGTLVAGNALNLSAKTFGLQAGGTVYGKATTLSADQVKVEGNLYASDLLTVKANDVSNSGTMASNATAHFSVARSLSNTGTIAANTLNLASRLIDNTGLIQGTTVVIDANTLNNHAGNAAGNLSVGQGGKTVQTTSQVTGQIGGPSGNATPNTGSAAPATVGQIASLKDLTINTLVLNNTAGGTIAANGTNTINTQLLNNAGGTIFGETMKLNAGFIAAYGTIMTGSLDIKSDGDYGVDGVLMARDTITFSVKNTLHNRGTISAGAVKVTAGTLDNTGSINANVLTVTADRITNTGTLSAGEAATIVTGTLDNVGGTVASAGSLNLTSGSVTNTGGTIYAGESGSLSTGQLSGDGKVYAANNFTVNVSGPLVNEASGEIKAGGTLDLKASGGLENKGEIEAGTLNLTTTVLDNRQTINGGAVNIKAERVNNFKTISGGNVDVHAGTLINDGEQALIMASNLLSITTTDKRDNAPAAFLMAFSAQEEEAPLPEEETSAPTFSVANLVWAEPDPFIGPDLQNINGATLYSSGDITIQSHDILNDSSLIEAGRNIGIKADTLRNYRYVERGYNYSWESKTEPIYDLSNALYPQYSEDDIRNKMISRYAKSGTKTTYTSVSGQTIVSDSPEAKILAGGDMTINSEVTNIASTEVTNIASTIAAGGDLWINGTNILTEADIKATPSLYNYGEDATTVTMTSSNEEYVIDVSWCQTIVGPLGCYSFLVEPFHHEDVTTYRYGDLKEDVVVSDSRPAIISARGNVIITGRNIQNGAAPTQTVTKPAGNAAQVGATPAAGAPGTTSTGVTATEAAGPTDPNAVNAGAPGTQQGSGTIQNPSAPKTTTTTAPTGPATNTATAPGAPGSVGTSGPAPVGGVTTSAPAGPATTTTTAPVAPSGVAVSGPGQAGTTPTTGLAAPVPTTTTVPGAPATTGTGTPTAPASQAPADPAKPQATPTPTPKPAKEPPAPSKPTPIGYPNFAIRLPGNAMYTVNAAPNLPLVTSSETVTGRERFQDSSEFFPGETARRIGDGYYEQKLVRDQLLTLQGFNYDQDSLNAYYRQLLINGAAFAKAQNLTSGAALTDAQKAALTEDVVVMVSREIDTPSGKQRVLVPVVYLADGKRLTGSVIKAGGSLIIKDSGNFSNTGSLQAGRDLQIDAVNINNVKGRIEAGNMVYLKSVQDITNAGGAIMAGGAVNIQAGRDFNNTTLTRTITAPGASTTAFDIGIVQGSTVNIRAENDVNFVGGRAFATAGNVTVSAGNNVNLLDVRNRQSQESSNGSRSLDFSVGSVIVSEGGSIRMKAGNALTTVGAQLVAKDDVTLRGKTINLLEGRNIYSETQTMKYSVGDWLGTTSHDTTQTVTVNSGSATSLSGSKVSVISQDALTSRGTVFNTTAGDVDLVSLNGKLDIGAMQTTVTTDYRSTDSSSGITFGKGGGLNVHIGDDSTETTTHSVATTNTKGQINVVGGNVNLFGGKGVDRAGVDVKNPNGVTNTDGNGYGINETPVQDTITGTSHTSNSETGLTLGFSGNSIGIAQDGLSTARRLLGVPGAPDAAPVGPTTFGTLHYTNDLFPTPDPDAKKPSGDGKTSTDANAADPKSAPGLDPRLGVALGAHLLRDAYDFGKSLSKPQNYNFSLTLDGSDSTTDSTSTTSTSVGNVTSSKEIHYFNNSAPGQPATDIVLKGSVINNLDVDGKPIKADIVDFSTNGKVKLGAGQNTSSSTSSSSNDSFSVGFGVGLADGDVKLIGSGSVGSSTSTVNTTTNTNTTIDTKKLGVKADVLDLTGANVNTVDAKIDVNKLIVKSIQDTATIENSSDQFSAGGSIGLHTADVNGGASTTQGQGSYQAVGTQTSLNITGTYDIKTHTTEVTGGVINAVPGQGTLTTDPGGLIITDLNDTSTYTTNTVGGNFAVGTSGISGSPNIGGKTLDDSGITRGGVTATVNGVDQTSSAVSSPPLKLDTFLNKPALAGQLTEAGNIFGKDAFTTAGDIGDAMKLDTGSTGRIALHMGAGALTAAVGGGNVVSGALAAGVNEAALPTLIGVVGGAPGGLGESLLKTGSALIGTVVGGITGGNALDAGAITQTATENNYLKHDELVKYSEALIKCDNSGRKDAEACNEAGNWEKLSAQRDNDMLAACVTKVNKDLCSSLESEAIAADKEYRIIFNGRFGEYYKGGGYINGGPGQRYIDNSPDAALGNVRAAQNSVNQINKGKNEDGLDPVVKTNINNLTNEILENKNLTIKQKNLLLTSLNTDVRVMNGIRNGEPGIFSRYGAAIETNLLTTGGDLATYLKSSGSLNDRMMAGTALAGGAGAITTAAFGGIMDRITGIGPKPRVDPRALEGNTSNPNSTGETQQPSVGNVGVPSNVNPENTAKSNVSVDKSAAPKNGVNLGTSSSTRLLSDEQLTDVARVRAGRIQATDPGNGVVSALQLPDGKIFVAGSSRLDNYPIRGEVMKLYQSNPCKDVFAGGCGEARALSKALDAGYSIKDLRGSVVVSVFSKKNPSNPKNLLVEPPCPNNCSIILPQIGVRGIR